jgi:hypothetical protein
MEGVEYAGMLVAHVLRGIRWYVFKKEFKIDAQLRENSLL